MKIAHPAMKQSAQRIARRAIWFWNYKAEPAKDTKYKRARTLAFQSEQIFQLIQ